ncbi:hypothetical protein [Alteraurantiacibacter palmitatis]|uniref:Uncharacterized protein n=1 Tax=Alteraurantiacibacter palmitatis TaxID=2054628 RepID=A0ABV7EBN4_9SPHN
MTRYAGARLSDRWGLAEGRVLAVRVLPLACVRAGILVEYDLAGQLENWRATGAFIWLPNRFLPLEGASTPFHDLNAEGALRLDTAAQAEQLFRLFCASVNGTEGAFYPMRPGFPILRSASNPHAAHAAAQIARPLAITPDGQGWNADATIAYASRFFAARFRVNAAVLVEMIDDAPLFGVIPGAVPIWRNGVLQIAAPDPTELDNVPPEPEADPARQEDAA